MEYLMTYGWAILIIAIVMVAMFSLGVFNPSEPRMPPGACEVYRSLASSPSLTGECQDVWPQFVAQFSGLNPGITVSNMNFNVIRDSYTLCAWANVPSYQPSSYGEVLVAVQYANSGLAVSNISPSGYQIDSYLGGAANLLDHDAEYWTWNFFCAVYAGAGSTLRTDYINANDVGTDTSGGLVNVINAPLQIGNLGWTCCGLTTNPPDYEANVQFYDTALSANEIQALYQEGIGGVPINPNNLVGWWPLNGNAQDYSGNNNQGTATAVTYTSAWTSGYAQP